MKLIISARDQLFTLAAPHFHVGAPAHDLDAPNIKFHYIS